MVRFDQMLSEIHWHSFWFGAKTNTRMISLKKTAAAFSVLAELGHVFCCGLPVLIAVLSAGGQIGLGGIFLSYHDQIHAYESRILIGSGLLLALGLALHFVSHRIDCRSKGGDHDDCRPAKFRIGWLFSIALCLFVGNVAFYLYSGHWNEPPRFN